MKLKKILLILIFITILFLVYLNPVYATEKIETINITGYKEPRLWQTFENNLKEINFNNENIYEVTKISWQDDENRFNLFGMYELTICLQAKDGYEFPDYGLVNVFLNGENAKKGNRWVYSNISDDKSYLEITISNIADFTVAGIIATAIFCVFISILIILISRKVKNLKSKPITTYQERQKKELSEESLEKVKYILNYIKVGKQLKSYKIGFEGTSQVTDIFESKLGGVPYWDMKKEYPCNSDGKKLVLLAQINLEKEELDDELLPKKGILQFFIDTDVLNGLKDKNGAKVIYHENIDYNIKKEDVESLDIKTSTMLDDKNEEYFPFNGEYAITLTKCIDDSLGTRANVDDKVKNTLKEKYNDTRELPYLEDYFTKEEYDYLWRNLDASGSKLLGYAEFTQEDPRNSSEYKQYDTLLLQIDSEGPIMWGDSGICNFFINKEDLIQKDFSNVLYNWDCM